MFFPRCWRFFMYKTGSNMRACVGGCRLVNFIGKKNRVLWVSNVQYSTTRRVCEHHELCWRHTHINNRCTTHMSCKKRTIHTLPCCIALQWCLAARHITAALWPSCVLCYFGQRIHNRRFSSDAQRFGRTMHNVSDVQCTTFRTYNALVVLCPQ